MARDSTVQDSRTATIGITLLVVVSLLNLSLCAPAVENWINDPCHYKIEKQIRHSRDANHSELWKKQFRTAKVKYNHELLPKMKQQYKQAHYPFNNRNCPSILIPKKLIDQTPNNYYEAIREYAVVLDRSAKFQNLPKTVNFNENDRKDIFELAVNMTKELLCEIYDSIPEYKRKTRIPIKTTPEVKIPHNVTKMLVQDYTTLKCFGRFLTMSVNKINGRRGKGGKNKKKGGKTKAKKNQKKPKKVANAPKKKQIKKVKKSS